MLIRRTPGDNLGNSGLYNITLKPYCELLQQPDPDLEKRPLLLWVAGEMPSKFLHALGFMV